MKRPQYVFRPNFNDPQHRRAWEAAAASAVSQTQEFLVQAILATEQTDRLEKSIRKVVREELQVVTLTEAIPRTQATDIIPATAIDFLASL